MRAAGSWVFGGIAVFLALAAACSSLEGLSVTETDGGTEGGRIEDAGSLDALVLPDGAGDAPADGPVAIDDGGVDACVACTGAGKTCTAGACNVDCLAAGAGACANTVCGAGLDCAFNCNGLNACQNAVCASGSKGCSFNCTAGAPACNNVTCVAPNCHVQCSQGGRCSGNVVLGGGDASVVCTGNSSCDGVSSVSCGAAQCFLDCDPNSCPPKACDGGLCTGDWDAAVVQ